jgi:hypothetical protein
VSVLTVVSLALVNLTFGIIPYSSPSSNQAVEFALNLREPLKNSTVYFSSLNTDDWFARYFTPSADWKHLDSTSEIDEDLRLGKVVWLETTAIDELGMSQPLWYAEKLRVAKLLELTNAKHRIRFARLF